MREGTSAPSKQIRAFLPCPTPTQRFKEKIHSTSIRFDSRLANCGENKPDRRTWCTSTCGTHISIPPDGSCSGGPHQDPAGDFLKTPPAFFTNPSCFDVFAQKGARRD